MKHTILMAISALVLLAGCENTQPKMNCNLAHGSYAVTYTRTSAPAAETSRCARTSDVIGVQKYTDNEGKGRVYLIPLDIGTNNFGFEGYAPIGGAGMAVGLMNSVKPNDNDVCAIDSFEVPSTTEYNGTLKYTFSAMEYLVRPDAPGTIGKFHVKIEDTGCVAEYDGVMVFPVVTCGDPDGTPNDAHCAEADHNYSGLALNPAFDVKCAKDKSMTFLAENYYDEPGGAYANLISSICIPRDPSNYPESMFCPESGCSWRPQEE